MNDNKRECNRCPNCDRRPYIDGHSDDCLKRSRESDINRFRLAVQSLNQSEVTK